MKESPLFWPAQLKGDVLWVLDETLLPFQTKYIKVKNTAQAVKVIRDMKTRAFGQFLVVLSTFLLILRDKKIKSSESLFKQVQKAAVQLNGSRPTFPFSEVTSIVVGWAHNAYQNNLEMRSFLEKNIQGYLHGIRARRLGRVKEIVSIIKDGDTVLTHCNVSGELAMSANLCRTQKKKVRFFATETRPYFQGAKLTTWEIKKLGGDVTLIADNAVASVLADGWIDLVIVGSDRSCANGDVANKIGTYQIAVLAKEFGVPMYVLTQPSNKIKAGKDIPIEMRDSNEFLTFNRKKIIKGKVAGFYPGFDVVPHALIKRSVAINVN